MAKGQIHMGKSGPERCNVDTSNPNSRGCPYESTGHYGTEAEAIESYATLNRVDAEELRELVADGATAKDAVGLIRSGYGRDYLTAAKRDIERVPDRVLEDHSSEYLEAKTQILLSLQDIDPDLTVKSHGAGSDSALVIGKSAKASGESFSYAVMEQDGNLRIARVAGSNGSAEGARELRAKLLAASDEEDSGLKRELVRAVSNYRALRAEEHRQAAAQH